MEPLAKDTLTGRRTGETVRTKLASIAQRAERDRNAKFCSLAHLMNKGTLLLLYQVNLMRKLLNRIRSF